MPELNILTAPKQRLVLRATARGVILETQTVLHDRRAHGWGIVAQHHLDTDQVGQMRAFLDVLTSPLTGASSRANSKKYGGKNGL